MTWGSFRTISDFLNVPICKVRAICALHLEGGNPIEAFTPKQKKCHLQPHHIDFLLDDQTLESWREHGLAARCELFNRRFPAAKLNHRRLKQVYQQHGIVYRVLKPGMALTERQLRDQTKQRLQAFAQVLRLAKQKPAQLLFCDEAVWSSRQAERKVWAKSKQVTLVAARNRISFQAVGVCGAMTVDGKMAHAKLVPNALDQFDFADFLAELRKKQGHQKRLFILVDNLGIHKTKFVQEQCARKNVELIFNGAYSSPFNPVERYWAFAKRLFSKYCLTATDFKNKEKVQTMVRLSLSAVNLRSLARHVRRCLKDMEEWLADYNHLMKSNRNNRQRKAAQMSESDSEASQADQVKQAAASNPFVAPNVIKNRDEVMEDASADLEEKKEKPAQQLSIGQQIAK